MNTISTAKLQQEAIDSGFLDLSASTSWDDVEPIGLDQLSEALVNIAFQFVTIAREKLEQADKISTAALAESIVPTQVKIFGAVYSVEIQALDYYKFIDEGVKGWADEKGGTSPYQYKATRPSKAMIDAIHQWVKKEAIKGAAPINKSILKGGHATRRETARSKIGDPTRGLAAAISYNVKKKGLAPTHFWKNTVSEVERTIASQLGILLKNLIIVNLTHGSRN